MSACRVDFGDLCSGFQNLHISSPIEISRQIKNFLKLPHQNVEYTTLKSTEPLYSAIRAKFTNKSMKIDKIIQVRSPFLEKAYELKKEQKTKELGEIEEVDLFHGTRKANLESICTYNFDWRRFGRNKGHKFGKGVCFSSNAKYAHDSTSDPSHNKVMIVAKVLIGKSCAGHLNMNIPPPPYDTSLKGSSRAVVVKYEDNEFYPEFIVHYHIDNTSRFSSARVRSGLLRALDFNIWDDSSDDDYAYGYYV